MAMASQKLKNVKSLLIMFVFSVSFMGVTAYSCSNGRCKVGDECRKDRDCGPGMYCFASCDEDHESICVRYNATDQFKIANNSLPFNKYAFLMTHNSYAIAADENPFGGPLITFVNQDDSITQQLKNGVRGLMLDFYDFRGQVWLCHSIQATCHEFTAFKQGVESMKEVASFLNANPNEIVTLIMEDHVKQPHGITNMFKRAGLSKYLFPMSWMPKNGQDWPIVSDMAKRNHRLVAFTSNKSKEETEGIPYQWNYVVENQFGTGILNVGICPPRKDSSRMDDRSKSLILLNHFPTIPIQDLACKHNSVDELMEMLYGCYRSSGKRWANFISIDYYKQSDGGGVFEALDKLNGKLICGRDDVHECGLLTPRGKKRP